MLGFISSNKGVLKYIPTIPYIPPFFRKVYNRILINYKIKIIKNYTKVFSEKGRIYGIYGIIYIK